MVDREKVVKGLEMSYKYSNVDEDNTLVPQWIVLHALALLKAQEPRVMTLSELEHTEIAYAEDKDKINIIPVLVKGRRYDRFAMVKGHLGDGTSHVFHPSIYDYGKRWRCWTSRPTDAQRQAVKWNG